LFWQPQTLANAHWASTTVQVLLMGDHVRTMLAALHALAEVGTVEMGRHVQVRVLTVMNC